MVMIIIVIMNAKGLTKYPSAHSIGNRGEQKDFQEY